MSARISRQYSASSGHANIIDSYTVTELKKHLESLNLSKTGNKAELKSRLYNALLSLPSLSSLYPITHYNVDKSINNTISIPIQNREEELVNIKNALKYGCYTETDAITFEEFKDMNFEEATRVVGIGKGVYTPKSCFKIESIDQWISMGNKTDPNTRNNISKEEIDMINSINSKLGLTDVDTFLNAVERNDESLVSRMITVRTLDVAAEDNKALRIAIEKGYSNIVTILLADKRIDANLDYGEAFYNVTTLQNRTMISAFLNWRGVNGETIDASIHDNWALEIACANGYVDIVSQLLKRPEVSAARVEILQNAIFSKVAPIVHMLLLRKDVQVLPSHLMNAVQKNEPVIFAYVLHDYRLISDDNTAELLSLLGIMLREFEENERNSVKLVKSINPSKIKLQIMISEFITFPKARSMIMKSNLKNRVENFEQLMLNRASEQLENKL